MVARTEVEKDELKAPDWTLNRPVGRGQGLTALILEMAE